MRSRAASWRAAVATVGSAWLGCGWAPCGTALRTASRTQWDRSGWGDDAERDADVGGHDGLCGDVRSDTYLACGRAEPLPCTTASSYGVTWPMCSNACITVRSEQPEPDAISEGTASGIWTAMGVGRQARPPSALLTASEPSWVMVPLVTLTSEVGSAHPAGRLGERTRLSWCGAAG